MAKRAPAFQFYPSDFISDEHVALMSLEQRGAYITLLCYCWREGSIPADMGLLGRLCAVDGQAMTTLWPGLKSCFIEADGDASRLLNPRLEIERRKQDEHRQKLSEAGKAGANSTWGKEKGKDGRAMAGPMAKPPASPSRRHRPGSGSSSSSSSLESSPAKARNRRKATPQQALGEAYRARWLDHYPDGVCDLVDRHFIVLADVLKVFGGNAEKALAALDRYFADTSPYVVNAKHPLELFRKNLSQYSTNGVGHEPALTGVRTFNC
jgi:uncharacterized protein YdaU (DUF1376 family)